MNAAQCHNAIIAQEEKAVQDWTTKKETPFLHSLSVLLLNPANLFLDIHALHLRHASSIFGGVGLPIVRQCGLLPACLFFWGNVHARSAIVDVLTLTGEALEIVRNINSVDRSRVSSFGLLALFLPARIE